MQRCLDRLSAACDDFVLTDSTTKTEVMYTNHLHDKIFLVDRSVVVVILLDA